MRTTLIVTLVVLLALVAQPAAAIQYGEPDNGEHPYTGAIVANHPELGAIPICSGTLISPTMFLTAAHCEIPIEFIIGITFDDVFDPENSVTYPVADFVANPDYDGSAYTDYAVIILEDEVEDIQPAELPELGVLDALTPSAGASKEERRLTAVGYGSIGLNRGTGQGQPSFVYPDIKLQAETYMTNLNKGPLAGLLVQTTAAPGTGGGTCYGDSGGPFFLGDTNIVVAITITGYNFNCGGADINLRIDVPHVLEFLSDPYGVE